MAIWKGKKTKKNELVKQLCPRCLQPHLRYASTFSGIYAPAKYICPDCGYKGPIYVDVSGNDKEEEFELDLLREEFPELVETQKTREELAQECLEGKWRPNQADNTSTVRAWCPFCADADVVCSICKCPPEICAKHATEGFIGHLNSLYDDETELRNIDPKLYLEIISAFQNIVKSEKEKK